MLQRPGQPGWRLCQECLRSKVSQSTRPVSQSSLWERRCSTLQLVMLQRPDFGQPGWRLCQKCLRSGESVKATCQPVKLKGAKVQHFAAGHATTFGLWAARLAALPGVPQIKCESVNPTCQPAQQPVGAQVKRFAAWTPGPPAWLRALEPPSLPPPAPASADSEATGVHVKVPFEGQGCKENGMHQSQLCQGSAVLGR